MFKEQINFTNTEEAPNLLKEGKNILRFLEKNSESLSDADLKEKTIEMESLMSELKKNNERDYIQLAGLAISVFNKIGNQELADYYLKENMERLKNQKI